MIGRARKLAQILDTTALFRGRLFPKFVAVFTAVVFVALLANATFETLFSYQDRKASLIRIQQEQAEAAAGKITEFFKDIEGQLRWTTYQPWTMAASNQQRLNSWRLLLRQVPAITELALLDDAGKERLQVSRLGLDALDSQIDFSTDPKFFEAKARKAYYGPVYFRHDSEPYMTLALAGVGNASVSVAEVNLKFIWDFVSQIKVGEHGHAYVVDAQGRLIAHPDISLVLRNINLSNLPQVQAARAGLPQSTQVTEDEEDYSQEVLTAYSAIAPLNWLMFVELPINEAYAPLYYLILRASILLIVGLLLAFLADLFLARRIVQPLEQLEKFASTVRETKDYTLRIDYRGNDEIGRLAVAFNGMLSELSVARERESSNHIALARASRLTMLGTLMASITHEINQPLAAIATNAGAGMRFLARANPDIHEANAALKEIDGNAHRASEVIKNIRSTFNKDTHDRALLNINYIVLEVLALVHGELNKHRISVESELLQDLPQVRADRIQIQQVILNLIINAVEAMDLVKNRARVLRVTSEMQEPGNALITVQDTGAGIDPKDMDQIFDAFFTTKSSGMGMGLSICRSIIEIHGGQLWASSGLGHGAVFNIRLPVAKAGVDE
jgi:two-component system NtrC family sensor kinase